MDVQLALGAAALEAVDPTLCAHGAIGVAQTITNIADSMCGGDKKEVEEE